MPVYGERILKVTKKSGNRGRCRKLSLFPGPDSTLRSMLYLLQNEDESDLGTRMKPC